MWEQVVPTEQFQKPSHQLAGKDKKLIHYLARNHHFTPFTHCQATFRIKVPFFIAAQIKKHQVGFSVNEVSRRYVDGEPEFYIPDVWRGKAENVKQGSSDIPIDIHIYHGTQGKNGIEDPFTDSVAIALETYNILLTKGVCPEQARMILPLNTFTEFWMTGSLYGWARMYNQRMDPHAQKEIQDVAKLLGPQMQQLFPVSWRALTGEHE